MPEEQTSLLKMFFFLSAYLPASNFEALTIFRKSESEGARGSDLGNQIQSGPRPLPHLRRTMWARYGNAAFHSLSHSAFEPLNQFVGPRQNDSTCMQDCIPPLAPHMV